VHPTLDRGTGIVPLCCSMLSIPDAQGVKLIWVPEPRRLGMLRFLWDPRPEGQRSTRADAADCLSVCPVRRSYLADVFDVARALRECGHEVHLDSPQQRLQASCVPICQDRQITP
jgi:hypothetical protein